MTRSSQARSDAGAVPAASSGPIAESFARYLPVFLVFIASFALYLSSMPKTVALEDDSIFILAGYFNGVSHPPGYPLYTLLLHLFTQVPIGDIAARAHASSAFFAALACCSLYCIFRLAGLGRLVAALGAMVFAFTATFWSQAIITEVYSLNVLLNLGVLLFALRLHLDYKAERMPSQTTARDFMLFSVLLGLAVANHWPLTVLAAPAYLLLIVGPFFNCRHKLVAVLPGLLVAGALYAWLYINNQSSPFINFSGRFADFGEFVAYVLRSHYASVDFQSTAGWSDKLQFFADLVLQIARELNLLLIFVAVGFYQLVKSPQTRIVGLAVTWAFLSNSLVLALLVNFDYSHLYWLVFKVYTIVSIAMLFVLAGYGMAAITAQQMMGFRDKTLIIVLLGALLLNVFFSLPQNFRHHYSWGEEYAQKIFDSVPTNAILFADGDVELGLLSYYHFIKGQRPDIELYSSSALLLDNRLFDYRLDDKKAFIETLVRENPQQQFYVANNYYGVETVSGNLYVDRLGKPETRSQQSVTSTDVDLLLRWSTRQYTRDPWTRIAIAEMRHEAIAIMTPLLKQPIEPNLKEYASRSINNLVQSDGDALRFLRQLLKDESEIDAEFYRAQLATIDRGKLTSKQDDSLYVYIAARASQARQTSELIEQARREACLNWPSPKNIHCKQPAGDRARP